MKKTLMLVLICLLLILCGYVTVKGFNIGNTEILGFKTIQDRSKALDEKIQEADKLSEKDYKQAISTVQTDTKKLQQEIKKYEDMTAVSSDGDVATANQLQRYEVEALWVKLGTLATSEGATMKMDIVKGTTEKTYNLNFTVTGSYISITDFISDIENDSTLGFKIEEFKMTSSGSDLQATFTCKEIEIVDIAETTDTKEQKDNTNNDNTSNGNTNTTGTNNNNTTNSTNSTNDTNSTNTSNTTSNTTN